MYIVRWRQSQCLRGGSYISRANISIVLTDISILLTDNSILLTEISILLTDISILLTEISILLTDISILLTEISILLIDISIFYLYQQVVQVEGERLILGLVMISSYIRNYIIMIVFGNGND